MELAWKALQRVLLRDHGIETASPNGTLQEAYRVGLISDEEAWLAMMHDRNLTSHTYREALAREIFARLPTYCSILTRFAAGL